MRVSLAAGKGVDVEKFDLETDEAIEGSWDVTVSFEVAEHLPESLADNYVRVISHSGRCDHECKPRSVKWARSCQ